MSLGQLSHFLLAYVYYVIGASTLRKENRLRLKERLKDVAATCISSLNLKTNLVRYLTLS